MLRDLIDYASKFGLSIKFGQDHGVYYCGLFRDNDVEVYSYSDTNFLDLIGRILDVIGQIDNPVELIKEIETCPL